jgi:hypothetical protein
VTVFGNDAAAAARVKELGISPLALFTTEQRC